MAQGVITEELHLPGGRRLHLALPEGAGDARPCVILLHERYGIVRHTLDLARRLAAEGFAAAAPDLFWRVADQAPLRDGTASQPLSDPQVVDDLEATVAELGRIGGLDTARLGMIGVCQTGRCPIVWATDHPLRACVVLYGAAQPREWETNANQPVALETLAGRICCPLLGIFGEGDHLISPRDVARLRASLEVGLRSYDVRIFRGAPHGWLNDTMPGRYRPEAAQDAWRLICDFLHAHLAGAPLPEAVSWRFRADLAPDYDFTRNVRLE